MKKLLITAIAAIATLHIANAQKIQWTSGDLSTIKGEKEINLAIKYDGIMVSEMPEQQFLDERRSNFNAEKPGDGDKFCDNWKEAKTVKYVNRFTDYFNKASKGNTTVTANPAKYTLILVPKAIDLGKGRYFGTKPALVDFEISIVETANPSNVIAKGTASKVKGESKAPKGSAWLPGAAATAVDVSNRVQNFDATNRIAESFELLAVAMGKAVK